MRWHFTHMLYTEPFMCPLGRWKSTVVKATGARLRQTWVQIPLLPLNSCVTLGKLPVHLGLRFLTHKMEWIYPHLEGTVRDDA